MRLATGKSPHLPAIPQGNLPCRAFRTKELFNDVPPSALQETLIDVRPGTYDGLDGRRDSVRSFGPTNLQVPRFGVF